MAGTASELSDLLTFYIRSQDNGYQAAELLGRPAFTPHYAQSAGWALFPVGHQRPAVEVVVAAAFRYFARTNLPILPRSFESTGPTTTGISTNCT